MLCAGRNWQPTTVDRVIQTFPTSTRVAKVVTDEGIAFLKGMGNPAGDSALACEIVAGELAAWIGLRVPEFAVVPLDLDVPMIERGCMQHGPAFVSRELRGGPDVAVSEVANPDAFALLVIFDSWVRNQDRWPPEGAIQAEPNRDNLFFTPAGRRFDLVALDHSHCFTEGDIAAEIWDPAVIGDDRIYGLFPEFEPYINEVSVLAAIDRLRTIDAQIVEEIVHSVPPEWGPLRSVRENWINVILARAQVVADTAPRKLLHQDRLGL